VDKIANRWKGREREFGRDYEQQPVLVGCAVALSATIAAVFTGGGWWGGGGVCTQTVWTIRGVWFWLRTDGCIMHGYGGISEEARTERPGRAGDR
jgi:hypothetical protein